MAQNAEVNIMEKLTPRQREIARLLADGLTQRQVAYQLGIKSRSVYNHTQRMRDRTGVRSTVTIAVKAAMEMQG